MGKDGRRPCLWKNGRGFITPGRNETGLEVPAFAKINLTLEVLGRRDDGYHEVRTILQTIDLADWLDIQPAPTLLVECDDTSLNGEANLVWRAAVAAAQRQGIEPKARIFIRKGIPAGM